MPHTQDIVQKLWNLCNILRALGETAIVPPGAASGTRYPIGQMHRLNI